MASSFGFGDGNSVYFRVMRMRGSGEMGWCWEQDARVGRGSAGFFRKKERGLGERMDRQAILVC